MKVIVAGGTGFIGGAVVQRLLELPSITSIVALSRRELPTKDPKITTVIMKDFTKYDDSVLAQFEGAEACIWALGKPTSGKDVHVDYTVAAINAISASVLPKLTADKQFRFIYTSGSLVEADMSKTTLFLGGMRKMRGDIQNKIVEFKPASVGGSWKAIVVRPALVTTGTPFWTAFIPGHYVPKEELAAAMVNIAEHGAEKQVIDNAELRQIGKTALEKKA